MQYSFNFVSVRLHVFAILVFISFSASAQVGGQGVFAFLNIPASARITALGGNAITLYDKDPSLAYNNPASLNKNMHNQLGLSFNSMFKGIKYGYTNYVQHFDSFGTFTAGLLYMNYGKFDGYNPNGDFTGVFNAAEYAFQLGYGSKWKKDERYSYGTNLKFIYSQLESYISTGIVFDFAGMYNDTASGFAGTLLVKNVGYQLLTYKDTRRQQPPYEVQIGLSKKLKHLPFRYNIILHNLQQPDLTYNYSNNLPTILGNSQTNTNATLGDKILRHFIIGGELNLSKNLALRFGYNHQRRKEMANDVRRGVSGFSWGIGFNISKIRFDYGSASFFQGFNTNQISCHLNLSEFYKK